MLSRRAIRSKLSRTPCATSDANRVRELLQRHPELRAKIDQPLPGYGFGIHALFAAVQRTGRATIDALLAAGANINKRTEWWAGGFGLLDDCAPELADFLTERGAVLDAPAAARLGRLDQLKELVAADPSVVHSRGGGRPDAAALRRHGRNRRVPPGARSGYRCPRRGS